jgi:hypothetical protein
MSDAPGLFELFATGLARALSVGRSGASLDDGPQASAADAPHS